MRQCRFLPALLAAVLAANALGAPAPPLPARLADTGLYTPGTLAVADGVLAFSPRYPLWSDGASKRRWIGLPPGTSIDARDPDAWNFPAGTRLWKEFGFDRPVETRFMERLPDGSWRFAVYAWNAAGTEALLVPAGGIAGLDVGAAPGGRYDIPSRDDCLACHEAARVPVLGFSALQLASHAAAPAASGAVDLAELERRALVHGLPDGFTDSPPVVVAATAEERDALGYLHGNCGHCHNDSGPLAALDLSLWQSATDGSASVVRTRRALRDLADTPGVAGTSDRPVTKGDAMLARMRSRNPWLQMPPLGTRIRDDEGLVLIERLIRNHLQKETAR